MKELGPVYAIYYCKIFFTIYHVSFNFLMLYLLSLSFRLLTVSFFQVSKFISF